ncbi:MAG: bifunctional folylpolyglutamate synthase/dihydrofolate synthase [Bacteroidota bacterium]
MKFGLRNTRALLASVGHPERRFPSIHVGGTNGKGSTSAFLASILMEAGHTTGLYTSPHLVRFTERIRVDGTEIDEAQIVEYTNLLRPYIEKEGATFFEATTCMAFMYFSDMKIDIAVIEVGLGGRLDSTNVLYPLVSVITNVSREHTEILGNTLSSIAREKGGIIKRGVPSVTGSTDSSVLRTLRVIARKKGVRLHESSKCVQIGVRRIAGTSLVTMTGRNTSVRAASLGLSGDFQTQNVQTAVAALDVCLGTRRGRKTLGLISPSDIKKGVINVVTNTGVRGRFETFDRDRRYMLDVAHNPQAVETLVASLNVTQQSNLVVVFGVMADKEYDVMIRILAPLAAIIVPVRPRIARALPIRELIRSAEAAGIRVNPGGSVAKGIQKASRLAKKGQKILITGSHYVVAEALEHLR